MGQAPNLGAAIQIAKREQEIEELKKLELKPIGEKRKAKSAGGSYNKKKSNQGKKGNQGKAGDWCRSCRSVHSGECSAKTRSCHRCGIQGHVVEECRFKEDVCFTCKKPGHENAACPNKKGRENASGSSTKHKTPPRAKGRMFQMSAKEAKEAIDVVACMFLVNSIPARVLFDTGANRSYVSSQFCAKFSMSPSKLNKPIETETADGITLLVHDEYSISLIEIEDVVFPIRLLPITLAEFDIVMGIDWLSANRTKIICFSNLVKIPTSSGSYVIAHGERSKSHLGLISMMKACKCISKGCDTYLAYAILAKKETGD